MARPIAPDPPLTNATLPLRYVSTENLSLVG
jgi:hypothetical protein